MMNTIILFPSAMLLQSSSDPILSIIPMLLIMVVAFFFLLRPQAKKQKAQDVFQTEIKKGDKVVTSSGIIGQITKIDEKEIQLQLDQKTFIRVVPSAISKEMTDAYLSTSEK